MPEIHYSSNGPINVKTYINGVAIDPQNFVVTLIPQSYPGEIAPPNITLVPINDDVNDGSYFVYVPLSISRSDDEYFTLRVQYDIPGSTTGYLNEIRYYIVRPYASIGEIIEASGFGTDRSDRLYKTNDEIAASERWARFKINAYTGQKFDLKHKKVEVIGDGTDVLLMPERIELIDKVWENDVLIYDSSTSNNQYSLEITPTNYAIRLIKDPGLDVFETYPYQEDFPEPAFFTRGFRYTILGNFGWNIVPSEVYESTIILANDFFYQDRVWKDKYIKRMQTGDWNVEVSAQAFTGTGNSTVDRILEPYIANRMVII